MAYMFLTLFIFLERLAHVLSDPTPGNNEALHFDKAVKGMHHLKHNPEMIQELVSKNVPVVEGDIIANTDRNAVQNIWPTTDIPYVISPELDSRKNDIHKALRTITKAGCLSFHKRTTEPDYLLFKNSPGCASYVGFMSGEQSVFIGSVCAVGNIVHEVLHSLGFYHEHTRMDREEYVKINPENIMKGSEKNFDKKQGNTFNIPYDIHSIMHYGSGYFSSNGLPTIVPLNPVKDMGQRVKLTERDTEKLRILYGCDSEKEVPLQISSVETGMGNDVAYNATVAPDGTTLDRVEPTFVSVTTP